MKSLFDVYFEELQRKKCDWCWKNEEDLYDFNDETVCVECLKNEEYEEPERGLTLEERNR